MQVKSGISHRKRSPVHSPLCRRMGAFTQTSGTSWHYIAFFAPHTFSANKWYYPCHSVSHSQKHAAGSATRFCCRKRIFHFTLTWLAWKQTNPTLLTMQHGIYSGCKSSSCPVAISVPDVSNTFSKIMTVEQMLHGHDCIGWICLADSWLRGTKQNDQEKKKQTHVYSITNWTVWMPEFPVTTDDIHQHLPFLFWVEL